MRFFLVVIIWKYLILALIYLFPMQRILKVILFLLVAETNQLLYAQSNSSSDHQPLAVCNIPFVQKTHYCANQGLTIVGNTILHFKASKDDHSSYADILRWDLNYHPLPPMRHNLGHAATVDYNREADVLAVGNGTWRTTIRPRLDLVSHFLRKVNSGAEITIDGQDVISIPLATDKKEIGGSGLICTWGGNPRIIYLLTGQNAPRKIFRCMLGVGSADFSDHSEKQDDETSWGTLIKGKSDHEYNGTLKVLDAYTGEETGVYQGCCYRNGYIYLCTGYKEPHLLKIQLNADHTYSIVRKLTPVTYHPDGSIISCEPEGLCFKDKDTMIVGSTGGITGLLEVSSF